MSDTASPSTTESNTETNTPGLRGVRRAAVFTVIGSLVLAAGIGIVAILTGDFGDAQWRILLTTLLIAGFSITALCHLAIVGRRLRVVGYAGVGMSLLAVLSASVLIWADWSYTAYDVWGKLFAVSGILAVSLAQTNLLLLLASRTSTAVRSGLWVTVALIGLLAVLCILPIVTDGDIPGDQGEGYVRFLVVVAILDALGTIALPVLARIVRDPRASAAVPTELVLRGTTATDLASLAARRGLTPETLVAEWVAAEQKRDDTE